VTPAILDGADLAALRAAQLLQAEGLHVAPDGDGARFLRLEGLGLLRWAGIGRDVDGGADEGCWALTPLGARALAALPSEGGRFAVASPIERLRATSRESAHLAVRHAAVERLARHYEHRAALYGRAAEAAEACERGAERRAEVAAQLAAERTEREAALAAKEASDAEVLDAYLRRIAMESAEIDPLTKRPRDPAIEAARTAEAWRRCEAEAPKKLAAYLRGARA
jgi:hypothetical protein